MQHGDGTFAVFGPKNEMNNDLSFAHDYMSLDYVVPTALPDLTRLPPRTYTYGVTMK